MHERGRGDETRAKAEVECAFERKHFSMTGGSSTAATIATISTIALTIVTEELPTQYIWI